MSDNHKRKHGKIVHLYLVRHAETEGMRNGIRLGNDDILSLSGMRQLDLLSKRLENISFDKVYCSPTLRAIQSLEIIQSKNKTTCKFITDADLVERREATSLIGVKTKDMPWALLKKNRLKRRWKYQDGESFDDIYQRSLRVLDKLTQNKDDSNILVMTHGSLIRALFASILLGKKLTPRQYFLLTEKLNIFASAISRLEYSQKDYEDKPSWKIITWMDTAHLDIKGF